jgi:hypothetical protein
MPRKKIYLEDVYLETPEDAELVQEIVNTYSAANFFNSYSKEEYEYDSDNYDGYSSY